jgi:hypothetical protein
MAEKNENIRSRKGPLQAEKHPRFVVGLRFI